MQCADCGHELEVSEENGKTYVKPCEHCITAEKKQSYSDGFADGQESK